MTNSTESSSNRLPSRETRLAIMSVFVTVHLLAAVVWAKFFAIKFWDCTELCDGSQFWDCYPVKAWELVGWTMPVANCWLLYLDRRFPRFAQTARLSLLPIYFALLIYFDASKQAWLGMIVVFLIIVVVGSGIFKVQK